MEQVGTVIAPWVGVVSVIVSVVVMALMYLIRRDLKTEFAPASLVETVEKETFAARQQFNNEVLRMSERFEADVHALQGSLKDAGQEASQRFEEIRRMIRDMENVVRTISDELKETRHHFEMLVQDHKTRLERLEKENEKRRRA